MAALRGRLFARSKALSWAVEACLGRLLVRPEYIQVCEDAVTGILLSQIVYWFRPSTQGTSKLSIFREGRWWVAKTQVEWCQETRISRKQYLRALQILLSKQIVVKRLWRFKGAPTLHLSLNLEVLLSLVQALPEFKVEPDDPIVPIGENPLSQEGKIHLPVMGQSCITENTEESTTEIKAQAQGADLTSLKEILETKAKNSEANLEAVWKASVAAEFGGFQKPFTAKERGQLKAMKTWLVEQKQDPAVVVKQLIARWVVTANEVRSALGLANCPSKPVIGWAMQYRDEVLTSLMKPAEAPKAVVAPVVAPAPVVETVAEAPYKPSESDIEALFGKLKK